MIIETKEDSPQSLIRYLLVLSGVERPIKVRISIDPEELCKYLYFPNNFSSVFVCVCACVHVCVCMRLYVCVY